MYVPNASDWWLNPLSGSLNLLVGGNAASPVVTFSSSGNVGISTTSALFPLQIYANSSTLINAQNPSGNAFLSLINNSGINSYFGIYGSAAAKPNETVVYSNAGSDIGIFPEGVEVIRFKSSGNVGIGTASPGAKLQVIAASNGDGLNVNGNNSFGPAVSVSSSTTGGATIALGAAAANGQFSSSALAGDGVLRNNGGNLMLQSGTGAAALFISTNNYVGIGATNPLGTLDVNGDIRSNRDIELGLDTQIAWNEYFASGFKYRASGYAGYLIFNSADGSYDLFTAPSASTGSAATNTPRVHIANSGSVGIGTTSPAAPLEVKSATNDGEGGIVHVTATGATGGVSFYSNTTALGVLAIETSGGNIFTGDSANSLALRAENSLHLGGSGNNLTMTLKSGNVGIGTASPGSALEVDSGGSMVLSMGQWQSWSPTFTGFSANPVLTWSRYAQIGKTILACWSVTTAGTSNATTYTMSLPVAGRTSIATNCGNGMVGVNGSTSLTGPVLAQCFNSTATFYPDFTGSTGWSASGNKYASGCVIYEAQ